MTLANQGKSWTSELNDQLLIGFDAGHDLETLCKLCGRTPSAIVSRLEYFGRLHMDGRMRYYKVAPDPWTNYNQMKALDKELKS